MPTITAPPLVPSSFTLPESQADFIAYARPHIKVLLSHTGRIADNQSGYQLVADQLGSTPNVAVTFLRRSFDANLLKRDPTKASYVDPQRRLSARELRERCTSVVIGAEDAPPARQVKPTPHSQRRVDTRNNGRRNRRRNSRP